MSIAQLYFEDVNPGDKVRPMYFYMDQMQLIEWGFVSGNTDGGHWHIWHNRFRATKDPKRSELKGYDPSVTGQFKTVLMERMLMDWAGPKSWVKAMDVQYRVWDHFFELKTFSGTVTEKGEKDGMGLVEVALEMAREDGRTTTKGSATVVLPKRG
mgnify:CR=1 FL=1